MKINKFDWIEGIGALIVCVGTILGIIGSVGNRGK